jgi:predicted AlkP superfamily pyrophosphatase or phosphodiesterase
MRMSGLRSKRVVAWLLALAAALATTPPAAAGSPGERPRGQGAAGSRAGGSAKAAPAAVGVPGTPPRLVVVISIDQFRGDYLTRFADLYLPAGTAARPGGFRYLMERGAYFTDAHHDHFPLFTGPGHSVLLTGAPPYKSGIVGNAWYDRDQGCKRYCVEDEKSPLVGAAALPPASAAAAAAAAANDIGGPPCALRAAGTAMAHTEGGAVSPGAPARMGISPATLRVDTLGDELKMATGRRAKVWGLAFKDRAAVLMAGHLADGVLWLDDESGAWITSQFYRPDASLPGWVAAWNARKPIDAYLGKWWELSVPAAALARLWTPTGRWASPKAPGSDFPHPLGSTPGKEFYNDFTTTPFGNDYVLETARELIRRERLGQGKVPDLLAINLSSNDYIGHAFGPDSPEVLDVSVRTDRQLAAFFGFLGQAVPGGLGNVLLAVTADHGVAPVPGAARAAKLPAGVIDEQAAADAAEKALAAAFGRDQKWVKSLVEENVYLDVAALDAHKVPHALAEETAAEALARVPGIYAAYGRTRILEGRLPHTDVAARVERSFHPRVSGDVVLVSDPLWMPGSGGGSDRGKGTTHGSPYAYDTSVPLLLAGAGVRPGRYPRRVSTLDLAPTLADLLGVLQPAGSEGRVLAEAER